MTEITSEISSIASRCKTRTLQNSDVLISLTLAAAVVAMAIRRCRADDKI